MKTVEAVKVIHIPDWRKYPDTEDTDYTEIMAQRQDTLFEIDGEEVVVRFRIYPSYRPYCATGTPLKFRHTINNLVLPPQPVIDLMIKELTEIAKECKICYWEHARHCYPPVAECMSKVFAHSILTNADDSHGSTEIRTEPVAQFFSSVFHGNFIWTEEGEKTEDLYRNLGVKDIHYYSMSSSGGFLDGLRDAGWMQGDVFDMDRRIQQLRDGKYETDLVFVGGNMGKHRTKYNENADLFAQSGVRLKLYGIRMKDDVLRPHPMFGYDPHGLGWPVANVYLNSFSTVNIQFIGLMATRPFDAWASGTLLFMWDPVGELKQCGIEDKVHYVAFDGFQDLINKVKYYKGHMDEVEPILRAGHAFGAAFPFEHSVRNAMRKVLATNKHKWGW